MKAVFDKMGVTVTLSPRNVIELASALEVLKRDRSKSFSLRKWQEEDDRIIMIVVNGDDPWE